MDTISASIIFLLLMSLSYGGGTAEIQQENIELGSSLNPNSHPTGWLSPSGRYAFGFYQQGSGYAVGIWLVGIKNNIVVWTANWDDPLVTSDSMLQLTLEGKLVLITEQGQKKVVIADGKANASSASMLDSGNFVLYNKNFSIIWQSFDNPTDTMLGGQSLPAGGQLFSISSDTTHSTRRFRLKMQQDGNVVMYPAYTTDIGQDAYWASNTNDPNGLNLKYHLYLNETGEMLIRNDSNLEVIKYLYSGSSMASKNYNTFYRATLDVDGVFRLYAHYKNKTFDEVFHLPDGNVCNVKGFCRVNSYCTYNDEQPYCNCLKGFAFIDPNQETLGCKRNFSIPDCAAAANYTMVTMKNIKWEEHPYFKAAMSQEDDCSNSCLADHYCWGALYEEGDCRKQGMPFRYVLRKLEGESSTTSGTAFLKVGIDTLKNHISKNATVLQQEQPPLNKSISNKAIVHIIVVTSVFTLLLCSMIAISSHLIYKIRVLRLRRQMENGNLGLNDEVTLRRFSYNELKTQRMASNKS